MLHTIHNIFHAFARALLADPAILILDEATSSIDTETEIVFQGYEVRAFHYLLKPVSFEPLMRCMDALTKDHSNQCYIFNDYKTTLQIPYNEIICFTSLKHSLDILTTKDIFKQRSTLNTIAGYLPDCFIRCHRSNIVNMKHIYKSV